MKLGYKILIIGTGILIFGILLSSLSYYATFEVTKGPNRIGKITINPGDMFSKKLVIKDSDHIRALFLGVTPHPTPVNVSVSSEEGSFIWEKTFTFEDGYGDAFFKIPKPSGNYVFSIKNNGNQSVTIVPLVGGVSSTNKETNADIPMHERYDVEENLSLINYGNWSYYFIGGALVSFAGFVTMIIGAITLLLDRKKLN